MTPSKQAMDRAKEIMAGAIPAWNVLQHLGETTTLQRDIAAALDEERARSEKLVEALELIKGCVDTDSVKTKTDDGEVEYWISDLLVQIICDAALESSRAGDKG